MAINTAQKQNQQQEQVLGQPQTTGGSKLKRIADILKSVGTGMQDIQAGYWGMSPGPMGQTARAYQASRRPKGIDPTGAMKNYEFYATQEMSAGREPLSFYDWQESLKKAGAARMGEPPPSAMEQKIEQLILEQMLGKLKSKKTPPVTGGAPGGGAPSGGGWGAEG